MLYASSSKVRIIPGNIDSGQPRQKFIFHQKLPLRARVEISGYTPLLPAWRPIRIECRYLLFIVSEGKKSPIPLEMKVPE